MGQDASKALMDIVLKSLPGPTWLDPKEDRLVRAIIDVEGAAADFAVLTSDAKSRTECELLASEANRLSLILSSAVSAALRKAATL